jgi:SIR2-like domain
VTSCPLSARAYRSPEAFRRGKIISGSGAHGRSGCRRSRRAVSARAYEDIVDRIEQQRGTDVFAQELRDAFSKNGIIPAADYLIAELFQDTLITTNYGHLVEQSFDFGGGKAVEVLTPATILRPPDAGKITVIKLHGNVDAPSSCILSNAQYAAAYGVDAIDLVLPIPQALDYYFRNSSLLFLGCSLNQDRTMRVFEAIKAKARADLADLPQHFSVEQCPADEAGLIARNEYLLRLGITPIWFPAGEFDFVEGYPAIGPQRTALSARITLGTRSRSFARG